MSVVQLSRAKALTGGFYTVQEAARLLHIDQEQNIKRWIGSYDRSTPVILRQYPKRGSLDELGFYDLMEIRFIDYFRRQNVSLQSLRKAAELARIELEQDHPFALSDVKFVTDRKRIFLHAAKEAGDARLMDIVSGQHAMYDVIEGFLAKGVEFAPSDGLVRLWRPEPKTYPHILLDPLRAHGQPVIENADVPTSAIFNLWRVEDQDFEAVADWFEVDISQVNEAVEFELKLAA